MEERVEEIGEEQKPRQSGIASRLIRFFLRILVVIVIGAGIGIAAYYGVPALYRDFVEPIQSNSQRVAALEQALAKAQVDFREKDSEIIAILTSVEGEVAQQREQISVLKVTDESFSSDFTELGLIVDENRIKVGEVDSLDERQNSLESRFTALEESLQDNDIPYDYLENQIQLLRTMELITRARFWMLQGNLGEAAEDLELAKGILETLSDRSVDGEALLTMIDRLDQVLLEISLNPIIAADDLEIVWQLLLLATEPEVGIID